MNFSESERLHERDKLHALNAALDRTYGALDPNVTHTPGPWTYDDDGMIYAEQEAAGKFFSVKVCDPHADKLDIDEREANARLIAAAPDLLAVARIQEAIDKYDTPGNKFTSDDLLVVAIENGYPHNDNLVGMDAWLKSARRAAVAKATKA